MAAHRRFRAHTPTRALALGALLSVLLPVSGVGRGIPAVIFLTPCTGGCTYAPGFEDPATNKSSLLSSTSNVSQYSGTQQDFDEIVACVKEILLPFAAEVVTTEPSGGDYLELVVAGTPQQIGLPTTVTSVAPFTCARQTDAIAFVFANLIVSKRTICEGVALEIGHLTGLDNEYQCPDVMSYLTGCGNKSFTDVDAQCGEYSARTCCSGGSTQNAYRRMLQAFGGSVLFGDDFESGDTTNWSLDPP